MIVNEISLVIQNKVPKNKNKLIIWEDGVLVGDDMLCGPWFSYHLSFGEFITCISCLEPYKIGKEDNIMMVSEYMMRNKKEESRNQQKDKEIEWR